MPQRKVDIRSVGGRLVAVKSASTELEVAALAHEADLLRRAAHPGVVSVVSFTSAADRAELVLTAPSEYTAAQRMPDSMQGCLDFVAAIADVVADLHAIGIAHGAIRPDHVLVAANEQPVLCGFGNAQSVVDPQLFSADVVAIGELLAWLARRMPAEHRGARRVSAILARSRENDTTARELAFAIVDDKRDAHPVRAVVANRPAMGALFAITAIATGAALFADGGSSNIGATTTVVPGRSATTAIVATEIPRVDIGGATYLVGEPGDLAFFVPCQGEDRVVVLRPGTGDLFVFDDLAEPGTPRTAQSVGRVEGALEVLPSADDTCSEFAVATDDALLPVPVPTTRSR
jgi:serine/threonine protein kinase